MGKIVSVHSFRGGTGKSNITANLAWLLAKRGARVAVLDTDLQSPGVHIVLDVQKDRIIHTLSDFVFGKCELEEAAYDLTRNLGLEGTGGALYLIPSSMKLENITRIISEGYDVAKLNNQLGKLVETLKLDALFIDTHPGMNRETLLTAAVSDALLILIRPDSQDFHGTAVLVEVANRLGVPEVYMIANKVVSGLDHEDVKKKIQDAFHYEVVGVLPLSEEVASLGSRSLFAAKHPSHPFSRELAAVVDRMFGEPAGTAAAARAGAATATGTAPAPTPGKSG
jgi:MinD-like ATPase involved in chromosome partitioning or flagellar assembly